MWRVWIFSRATQYKFYFNWCIMENMKICVNLNKTLTSTGKFRPFNKLSAQHAQEKWYIHCTV